MKILKSGAAPSAIVSLSQKIGRLSRESGREYLRLERGIPAVRPIDLQSVAPFLPFNDPQMQSYPPSTGRESLKTAINDAYFGGKARPDRIVITPGGSMGLDIAFQVLDAETFFLPEFHWGTYRQILKTRGRAWDFYASLGELADQPKKFFGTAVVICDPGNPLGSLEPEGRVIETARRLAEAGVPVLIDCPYRRLFLDPADGFYRALTPLESVVIIESFSKSLGLSGLRVGFVHASDPDFIAEFSLRLALPTNGVDNIAQAFVEHLLAHPEGMSLAGAYRAVTTDHTARNLSYLKTRGLLASEFYKEAEALGIFAAVNRSPEELLESRIGSISLASFTEKNKGRAEGRARVNIAVPHETFVSFFDAHLKKHPSSGTPPERRE
ncbi:MAG: pyridoxal phosphate-dependent aminotransferase [Candidatus Aminicenantes bacterium]|nr:pyridoxal phosphate-dependent aminotransferase [Candidatus Aminicenantes bacterium]